MLLSKGPYSSLLVLVHHGLTLAVDMAWQ